MKLALACVTLFLGGGVLLLNGIVMVQYLLEWSRTPGRRGMIPLHVWLVAGSYELMVVLMLLGGISGVTDLGDWRAYLRIPALALGLAAQFVLVSFQRKTYSHIRRDRAERRDIEDRAEDRRLDRRDADGG